MSISVILLSRCVCSLEFRLSLRWLLFKPK
uniref:Uncharacterized protein n=1 Tax=Arundo donax TaxID=35708 RepID=A0A0A9BHX1_ARUDO